MPVWHQTPLFYVTILATLCIKGLNVCNNIAAIILHWWRTPC